MGDARRAPALTVLVATMAAAAVAATGYAVDTSAGRSSVTPPAQTETPRAPESTPAAIGGQNKTVRLVFVRVKLLSGGRVGVVLKNGKVVVLRPGTILRMSSGKRFKVVSGRLVPLKASPKSTQK